MKCLGAMTICIAVLYGVDAAWFDGWYFGMVDHMLNDFYRHWFL